MKPLTGFLVLAFAAITLISSIVLMPAAELMPSTIQSGSWAPGLSPIRSYGAMQWFHDIDKGLAQVFFHKDSLHDVLNESMHDNIPGEVKSYILYAVFLSVAMIAASIAIASVGRWDSEEKTVIPVKK